MGNNQVINGSNNNVISNEGGGNQVVNIGKQSQSPTTRRLSSKDFSIFGRPFKTKWLLVSGIVSFIADILAIAVGFPQILNNHITFYFLILFSVCWFVSLPLYGSFRLGHLLRIGGKNYVDRQGVIKEEKYHSSPCPQCGGELTFATDQQFGTILRCYNYPNLADHRFAFSTKIFDASANSH